MLRVQSLAGVLAVAVFVGTTMPLTPLDAQTQTHEQSTTNTPSASADSYSMQSYVLNNGLELIMDQQTSAQKIFLGIAVKGGTDIQTNKTAGLFRLIELLSFRGEASHPGEPEPAAALEAIGAEGLNGGILQDGFVFSYVVKPEQLKEGINTLQYLFSTVRLDTAFSDTKALAEAKEEYSAATAKLMNDPDAIYERALDKKLFAQGAWRRNAEGPDSLVAQATQAALKALINQWFLPNNAAIVVCGNFSPEEAKSYVTSAFGNWEKGPSPWQNPPKAFPKPGVSRPTFLVFPDSSISTGTAKVELRYRAPDVGSGKADAAMLWAQLAADPTGRLATAAAKSLAKGSNLADFAVHYVPSKNSSYFSVSANLAVNTKPSVVDNAMSFKEVVRGTEGYALKTNASYYAAKDYAAAAQAVAQSQAEKLRDPEQAGVFLMNSWVTGAYQWWLQTPERLAKLGPKDIQSFADEYFMKNLEVVGVRINPADYEKNKKTFAGYGFEVVSGAKAFWWQ
ncbi:MAG TPA: insulinase family protein [Spirochaetales bacterium]|mgnify:CR=1 FL=1|nr:insulinase family protein [Spirochaetales bacterium]